MRGSGEDQDKADLLVFGYACKIFRDDERASLIDAGAHLIPWMGDDSLKIDRYDGRGALYDLASHEPKDFVEDLGEEEKTLEQLCDEERYRSMYINEEEELTYKEEEAKRQHHQSQNYGEVAYSYDVSAGLPEEKPQEVVGSQGKPFVPSAELQLPPDMAIPKTAKHNAIIEKTALFLAQQGSQMEILMKVKQQGNKNFEFLSHTDSLHSYYLHLKGLIKSGNYVPKEQLLEEEDSPENDEDDGNYLHPSLITARAPPSGTPPGTPNEEKKIPKPPIDNSAPPDYVQKIIEVMVKYVIKNGPRFEAVILKRGDVRFSFLNHKNPYNAFYKSQLDKKQKEIDSLKSPKKAGVTSDVKTLKRKPLPVCFSIKKPKESEGLDVPSALPVEESSEDDEGAATPPKQNKEQSAAELLSATLERRLKKPPDTERRSKSKREERKSKVAQFIKDLKKKTTDWSPVSYPQ